METIEFWDYDRNASVTCPECGWSGPAADGEALSRELLDVRCPVCKSMLLIIPFPTVEETRAAAAAGNGRAQAGLPDYNDRQRSLIAPLRRSSRALTSSLTSTVMKS